LSGFCMIRLFSQAWGENIRHVLPMGRYESYKVIGSLYHTVPDDGR
jgi:hypothetical protein